MIKILIALAMLAVMGGLFGALQTLLAKDPQPKEEGEEQGEQEPERLRAVVHCSGCGSEFVKYHYQGIQDCLAASLLPGGGPLRCDQGCLGMGTCAKVCPNGAVRMGEGTALVDQDLCQGCGKCVEACPRGLIALEPFRPKRHVYIPCSSLEPGEVVAEFCSNGCIGCALCAKECPREAITVEGTLARIDYEKCDGCGLCVPKCPRHLIQTEEVAELPKPEPEPVKPPKPPKEKKGKGKESSLEKGEEGKPLEEEPLTGKEPEEAALTELLLEVESAVEEEKQEAPEPVGTAREEKPAEEPEKTGEAAEGEQEPQSSQEPAGKEAEKAEEKPEEKTRSSEEAFRAFEQIVAAAGEVLGTTEEAPKEEAAAAAGTGGEGVE